MERKLVVKICTGTLCYVTGGAELQSIDEHIPEHILDQIDIIGSTCADHEETEDRPQPPIVKVGDVIIPEATIEKVVTAIKAALGEA